MNAVFNGVQAGEGNALLKFELRSKRLTTCSAIDAADLVLSLVSEGNLNRRGTMGVDAVDTGVLDLLLPDTRESMRAVRIGAYGHSCWRRIVVGWLDGV